MMQHLAEEIGTETDMVGEVGWSKLHDFPSRQEETDTVQKGRIIADLV